MRTMQGAHRRLPAIWGWLILLSSLPLGLNAASMQYLSHASATTEAAGKADAFVLQDQYDNTHAYGFPKAKVSVLLFADYKGHSQLEPWIRPLYERYRDGINIHGVADLSAVPGFLRGIVRNAFRKQLDYPVMLDWRGTVSERYAYQKGSANLLVIDCEGAIKLRLSGAATDAKLQTVWRHIDHLLVDQIPCSLLPTEASP